MGGHRAIVWASRVGGTDVWVPMSQFSHNTGGWPATPPPPTGLGIVRGEPVAAPAPKRAAPEPEEQAKRPVGTLDEPRDEGVTVTPGGTPERSDGHNFNAELDMAELDDRDRPGSTWAARARRLSRSKLVVASRRMCYPGRMIIVAVHLIDARPVPLFGQVVGCEYDGEGIYRVEIDMLPCPDTRAIRDWLSARG